MNVFILNGNSQYENMFEEKGWIVVDHPKDADIIQFCGGSDVSPHVYFDGKHPKTSNSEDRDNQEIEVYTEYETPMVGICRGAQFLWAMNWGRLFQDVKGHALKDTHEAIDLETFKVRRVTSTHHQMMMHTDTTFENAKMIALATDSWYKEWADEVGDIYSKSRDNMDIEAAFFPETVCLCFQPHPEYEHGDCQDYYFELLEKYLTPYIYQG